MSKRNEVVITTASGEEIFIEVESGYDAHRDAPAKLDSGVLASVLTSLLRELRPQGIEDSIKSFKVEFSLNVDREGNQAMVFVAQKNSNALFNITIEFSKKDLI